MLNVGGSFNKEGFGMSAKRVTLVLIAVIAGALVSVMPASAYDESAEAYERIGDLKQDISILNLLNGLHLTGEQRAAILAEARNAQAIRDRYLQNKSEKLSEMAESLEDLKLHLMNPQAPPPKEIERGAKRNNSEIKRVHESYIREIGAIEKRVAKILTDGQKEILVDFKPCLVPPKNLRNPTRAGQAHDYSRIEKFLTRSRHWSDDVYERRLDLFLDKFVSKVEEKQGPMTDAEEMAERGRVRAIVEEAQSMNDVDFELSKQELAERIDIYKDTQKKKALVTEHKGRGQIARFLLSERALPILEQRVQLASGQSYLTTTRLDSIKPAEDCRQACDSTK
jgi:hypothetical protein